MFIVNSINQLLFGKTSHYGNDPEGTDNKVAVRAAFINVINSYLSTLERMEKPSQFKSKYEILNEYFTDIFETDIKLINIINEFLPKISVDFQTNSTISKLPFLGSKTLPIYSKPNHPFYPLFKEFHDSYGQDCINANFIRNAGFSFNEIQANFFFHAGADINAKDVIGRTALLWAAEDCNLSAVNFLIKHGADINVKDPQGKTASMLAIEKANSRSLSYFYSFVNPILEALKNN
jgi:hypothetical protein